MTCSVILSNDGNMQCAGNRKTGSSYNIEWRLTDEKNPRKRCAGRTELLKARGK